MDEEILENLACAPTETLHYYRRWEELQKSQYAEHTRGPLSVIWERKIAGSELLIDAIDAEISRRQLYGY